MRKEKKDWRGGSRERNRQGKIKELVKIFDIGIVGGKKSNNIIKNIGNFLLMTPVCHSI